MFKQRGQSTLEYALIIAVVVGGLLLMQHYIRRGLAGRYRAASDDIGEQFDPSAYTANYTINQSSATQQTVTDRVTRTEHTADQISKRDGTEDVEAWGEDQDIYSR